MHLLINELQVHDLPIRNNLIQKLDHYVLGGLPSENQLEYIIVKQVRILEIVQHKIYIKTVLIKITKKKLFLQLYKLAIDLITQGRITGNYKMMAPIRKTGSTPNSNQRGLRQSR